MKRPKDISYAKWLGFYYLGKRAYSIGELREKLLNKEVENSIVDEAIFYFIDNKYLNDEEYARNYVENALKYKAYGKFKIKQKLREKKVPSEIIEDVLGNIDSTDEALEKAFQSKSRGLDLKDRKDKEKLVRRLASRGFAFDDINRRISDEQNMLG